MPTERQFRATYYQKRPYQCRLCGDTENQMPSRGLICRTCATKQWREYERLHPTKHRIWLFRARLKNRFSITPARWMQLWIAQHGGCAVCDKPGGFEMHVDHDHACCPGKRSCGRCVRGLLCRRHNLGLGHFSVVELQRVLKYLE